MHHLTNIEARGLPAVTVLPYDVATARVFGRIRANQPSLNVVQRSSIHDAGRSRRASPATCSRSPRNASVTNLRRGRCAEGQGGRRPPLREGDVRRRALCSHPESAQTKPCTCGYPLPPAPDFSSRSPKLFGAVNTYAFPALRCTNKFRSAKSNRSVRAVW